MLRLTTLAAAAVLSACSPSPRLLPADSAPIPAPAGSTGAALARACEGRDGWDDPAPPAQLSANTWYVGTCGITALLVTSQQGHVLVDTGTAAASASVLASVERAGFRPHDIRWIVASHEHHDHVGGMAAIRRATGARVAALAPQAEALRRGQVGPDDPQAAIHDAMAPVPVDRVLVDGEELRVGPLRLRASATPAHSPGSTSWTWNGCNAGECPAVTYADSATAISADAYRFGDHPARIMAIRHGLARIASLPCGVLVTPHPSASGLFERLAAGPLRPEPAACANYAASARARFEARLVTEAAAK